jgi:intracellular septation protein
MVEDSSGDLVQSPSDPSQAAPLPAAPPSIQKPSAKMLLLGGLLPVIAFTVVEEIYGTKGGLVAGILFGAGEMIYEYVNQGKVQKITIGANLLVVILGALSLIEEDGVWFKMQPAIMLVIFALFMLGSSLMKKPFLVAMARKQNPTLPEPVAKLLAGMNFRLSFVFLGLAALSVYAALHWSTAAWATLKGVGTPILLVVYMVIEVVVVRILKGRQTL